MNVYVVLDVESHGMGAADAIKKVYASKRRAEEYVAGLENCESWGIVVQEWELIG